MLAHPLPGTEVKARWTARLKQQAGDIERLTSGMDEAVLARRPIPDKWSLKELIAHLWRVEQVFEGRVLAMLKEDNPVMEPYEPEGDMQFMALLESSAAEILGGFLRDRGAFVERLETLGPGDWKRTGRHGQYRYYDVEFCVEYLAHHEAHHIYQMFQRRALL